MPIAGFCWMMQIPPSAAHLRGLSCSSYPFSTWEVSCHCIPLWIQHQPWQRGWITAEVPPGLGGWDLPWGHCKGSLTLARAPRVQSSASAWFPRLALPQVNPTDLRLRHQNSQGFFGDHQQLNWSCASYSSLESG